MKTMKKMKAELCDQLLRRMEQATNTSMHQNLHNKLNRAPTWASVAAREEPPVKTIPTKTLREVMITHHSCKVIPEAEQTPEAIVKQANEAIKNITKRAVVAARHMPKQTVESVYKQNPTLQCRALIHKVNKITVKQQKPHESIIINVTAPHQVNTLIDSDIILNNEYCTAEIFHREAQVTQYFNCQQYEHITHFCQREKTCSHCAQKSHSDKTYPEVLEDSKPKCSNCGENHTAWNPSCPERKAVTKSTKKTLIEQPKHYEIRAPDTEDFNYPRKRNRPQQNEPVKTPRRAGRPTDIARAEALQQESMTGFIQATSSQSTARTSAQNDTTQSTQQNEL
ncbi:hypothetical protein GX50_08969 [[Emmonsia] crescens]|uniref:Uncharacterized protein n=1 Tax=[Emmonsia] crescens TaxID=73230 RepID=A0A2B7Z340_9EURO|nr:hypothetical protein GX50_08969 [Emmonsia crescens]